MIDAFYSIEQKPMHSKEHLRFPVEQSKPVLLVTKICDFGAKII